MSLRARRLSTLVLALTLMLVPITASAAPVGGAAGFTLDAFSLWHWVAGKVRTILGVADRSVEAPVPGVPTQKVGTVMIDVG